MAIDSKMQMADVYTNGQGLANLKLSAKNNSPEASKAVAKQFEALFLQMMLKSMRASSTGNGLFDSDQSKMYMDLFDKQIALKMSQKGTFGMAQVLEKQLNRDTGKLPVEAKDLMKGNTMVVPGRTVNSQIVQTAEGIKARIKQQVDNLMQSANVKSIRKEKSSGNFENPLQFAKAIWNDVKTTANKLGVSPKALLAQSILETGWGKHIAKNKDGSSSNNIFGIKSGSAWVGDTVNAKTNEFVQGKKINLTQTFRSYNTPGQSLGDYAKLLQTNPQYKNVLKNGLSVPGFAKAMQASGYATDPEYGAKIMSIVESPQFKKIMSKLVL